MKISAIFLLSLFVLHSAGARAYDPQIGHKPLINIALKVYAQCFREPNFALTAKEQSRIIEGDIAMDEGLKSNLKDALFLPGSSVFSKLIRPFNWHFYNPDLASNSKVGLVEQSHKNLWNKLKVGFENSKNTHDKLLFVGGIIHLVEDLTVPAHVVPVYHGPTASKYLGPIRLKPLVTYMQAKGKEYSKTIVDKIDVFAPDVKRLETELLKNKDLCERVKSARATPDEVRATTSNFTLCQLAMPIPDCRGVMWQDFWLKPEGTDYFGRYNIAHNNPLFGDEGTLSSANAKCKLGKNDKRYADFVFMLHTQAIESDVQLLYWANAAR